jgi:hypothetical protein
MAATVIAERGAVVEKIAVTLGWAAPEAFFYDMVGIKAPAIRCPAPTQQTAVAIAREDGRAKRFARE